MMKKTQFYKIFSAFLSIVLLFTAIPVSAIAVVGGNGNIKIDRILEGGTLA